MSKMKDSFGRSGRGQWGDVSRRRRCVICGSDSHCQWLKPDGAIALCKRNPIGADNNKINVDGYEYFVHRLDGFDGRSSVFRPSVVPSQQAASAEILDEAYRIILSRLSLADNDRLFLRNSGLSDAYIKSGMFRSITKDTDRAGVASEVVTRFGEDIAVTVPGIASRNGIWLAGAIGLIFPLTNENGLIYALKTRSVGPDGRKQYFPLSSAKYGGPSPAKGVFVPTWDRSKLGSGAWRVTEGERKALTASSITGVPTIGVPSLGEWRNALPLLLTQRVETVLIAFDQDESSDTRSYASICAVGLADALIGSGVYGCDRVLIETWDKVHGKGIDDVANAGKMLSIVSYTVEEYQASQSYSPKEDTIATLRWHSRWDVPREQGTISEVRDAVYYALKGTIAGTPTLIRVPPGTGKSTSAARIATERASDSFDKRTVFLALNHASAKAFIEMLPAWISTAYCKKIELPGCDYPHFVSSCYSMGLSPRTVACKGKWKGQVLGDQCPNYETCEEAKAWEGDPEKADVIVGTHKIAMDLVRRGLDREAVWIVDECSDNDLTHVEINPEVIRSAAKLTPRSHSMLRGSQLELLMGSMAHALESVKESDLSEPVLFDGGILYMSTQEGLDTAKRCHANRMFSDKKVDIRFNAEIELKNALECRFDKIKIDKPLMPNKGFIGELRRKRTEAIHSQDKNKDVNLWKIMRSCELWLSGMGKCVERDGDKLKFLLSSKVWESFGQVERIAYMDGTMDPALVSAWDGRSGRVLDLDVPDAASVTRLGRPTRDAKASKWCRVQTEAIVDSKADSVSLVNACEIQYDKVRGPLRDVVQYILGWLDGPGSVYSGGIDVVWAVFRPLINDFTESYERSDGKFSGILGPLKSRGVRIRWIYWHGVECRGSNEFVGYHVAVAFGDPNKDWEKTLTEEEAAFGLDYARYEAPILDTQQTIRQMIDRIRPSLECRTEQPLLQIVVGEAGVSGYQKAQFALLPPSKWSKELEVRGMVTAAQIRAACATTGLPRYKIAHAIGVSEDTLNRWLSGRTIPPNEVLDKILSLKKA